MLQHRFAINKDRLVQSSQTEDEEILPLSKKINIICPKVNNGIYRQVKHPTMPRFPDSSVLSLFQYGLNI